MRSLTLLATSQLVPFSVSQCACKPLIAKQNECWRKGNLLSGVAVEREVSGVVRGKKQMSSDFKRKKKDVSRHLGKKTGNQEWKETSGRAFWDLKHKRWRIFNNSKQHGWKQNQGGGMWRPGAVVQAKQPSLWIPITDWWFVLSLPYFHCERGRNDVVEDRLILNYHTPKASCVWVCHFEGFYQTLNVISWIFSSLFQT